MTILTKLSSDNFKVIAGFLGEASSFTQASKASKQCAEESFYPVIFKAITAEPALAKYIPENVQSLPNDAARVRAIYKRFIFMMHALGYAFIDPKRVSIDVGSLVRLDDLIMRVNAKAKEKPQEWLEAMILGKQNAFYHFCNSNNIRIATEPERLKLPKELLQENLLKNIEKSLPVINFSTLDPSLFEGVLSHFELLEPSCLRQMLDAFCNFWISIWKAITSLFS